MCALVEFNGSVDYTLKLVNTFNYPIMAKAKKREKLYLLLSFFPLETLKVKKNFFGSSFYTALIHRW